MRTSIPLHTRAGLVVAATLLGACQSWPFNPTTVVFQVSVPPSTPVTASVVIVADTVPPGLDQAPSFVLTRVADGRYTGKATLDAGGPFGFNIVQRNPSAIELLESFDAPYRAVDTGAAGETTTVYLSVARWVPEPGPTQAPVQFEVAAPASTPDGATLYLTGDAPELGAWRANGVPLSRRTFDGKHVARVNLEKGRPVQFKVTRGSWDTQERGAGAEDIPNRTYVVPDEGGRVEVSPLIWQDRDPRAVLTGDIRYERAVPSTFLGNTRDVIIHLPVGYAQDPSAHYPVLFMHDGQNLMDPKTSFSGEWGVDEAAQRLQRCGQMAPVIIVGVYNTTNRIPEYTQVPNAPYGGGNADNYGRFLMEELKPIIDSRYRTIQLGIAPVHGVAGSSLGGLVSLYLGLKYPGTFGRIGAVSPSIWWAEQDITKQYQALPVKLPSRIWEDMGTAEGSTPEEEVANARAFRDALVAKGWGLGTDLQYLEVPQAGHTEAAWARRVDRMLSYLYPPQQ